MTNNEQKIMVSNNYHQKGIFKLVSASKLSLGDDFLKYQPNTYAECKFKKLVETAIKSGLKDFWRPACDPSLDYNGRICYEPGEMPAVGKSYNWWEKTAKEFNPEHGSRLGTKNEYIAFLAVLIKELVASGKSVEWAWKAVSNDSKELGHYWNSANRKEAFETTGSREICGWYDLANSYKILEKDKENGGFWLASGFYEDLSFARQLADLSYCDVRYGISSDSCGWLVFDSCPEC